MLYTLDKTRKQTAVLENAFDVSYEKTINQLWTASFSLPLDDEKVSKVELLQFIEIIDDETQEYIGLFRVLPKKTVKNISQETVTFELEHVLGTLLGGVLFKYHQIVGHTTADVIHYVLTRQRQNVNWILGECDFSYVYDYAWESENILSALFSITKTFQDEAMWTFDTSTFPWKLNLKRIDPTPVARITEGYNLTGLEVEENPNGLWNRIYPLGSAEGVNQVDIMKVNNNIPYIEDTTSISKYGLYETIFVDKEITDDKTLLQVAKKKLEEWKNPIVNWSVKAVDLSRLTGIGIDKLKVGTTVRVQLDGYGDQDLLIVKESKRDAFGSPENIELELGNLGDTLASANAEQMRRQQVSDLYSQGATNILNFGYQDNCDNNIPALITFYLDEDVVNVNTCELTFETKKFRAYSGTTASGGGTSKSTASGGGTSKSTGMIGTANFVYMSTGQPAKQTGSGGKTSIIGGLENHFHQFLVSKDSIDHNHTFSVPSHTHEFSVPTHTHGVEHKIVESGSIPSSVTIKVDGNSMPINSASQERLNLINYLRKDSEGKVSRGKHTIEIYPNGLARIEANLILRVFIQSQLGGKY